MKQDLLAEQEQRVEQVELAELEQSVKPGRQAVLAVQEQLEEQVVPEELERSVRLDLLVEPVEQEQRL